MKYVLVLLLTVIFSGCVKDPTPSPSNKSITVDLECKSQTSNETKNVRVFNFYPYRGLGIGVNVWSLTSSVIYNNNATLMDNYLFANKQDTGVFDYTNIVLMASAINRMDASGTIFLNSRDNTATIDNIKYNCEDMTKAFELAKQELTPSGNKLEEQK